jgi:hypothetical protein
MMIIHVCWLHGAFPEVIADVVLSNDNDDADSARLPGQTATTDQVVSTTSDTRDVGKSSAEANIPGLTGASAPGTTRPPTVDRALITPAWGARGCKWLRIAVKWSD